MDVTIHKLVRSRRRTIAIEITPDAELIVRAPTQIAFRHIEKFILDKKSWILNKQKQLQQKKADVPEKFFLTGEKFLFLGTYFPLSIIENAKKKFMFDNHFFLSAKYRHQGKKLFENWYKETAKKFFTERAVKIAQAHGLHFSQIKINSAKRRWGSCTFLGNINLCWRLIMAPLHIIDYVIAHELAHLVHKNHSARFWKKVSEMHPAFKQDRKWLKEKGHLLII